MSRWARRNAAVADRLTARLSDRQIVAILRIAQLGALTLGISFLFWLTPLSASIDDDFRLTPAPTEVADEPPEDAPSFTLPPTTTTSDTAPTTTTEPTTTTSTSSPTTTTSSSSTTTPTGPSSSLPSTTLGPTTTSSTTTTTVPGPTDDELATDFVDGYLAATTGEHGPAYLDGEVACAASDLATRLSVNELTQLASGPAPTQISPGLHPPVVAAFDACLPAVKELESSLLEGLTPPDLAACMAGHMAATVGWSELLALEIDPEDPIPAAVVSVAAGAATVACFDP